MRPIHPVRLFFARALTAFLSWAMVFGPISTAYGAPTPLADIPIAAKVSAKPNIVYTLDDSGSMQYNYLPDFVVNASASIPLTNITRAGSVATATLSVANNALLSVGDYVTIAGASPAEFNGFYQIVAKPSTTTFTYTLTVLPVATASTGTRVLVTSSAYCRQGNTTAVCTAQAMNIGQTTIGLSEIRRPLPLTTAGPVTVTAKWTGLLPNATYNQLALLQDGDVVLIQNTAAAPIPATTSAPYYGLFTIAAVTRSIVGTIGTITFTYVITAIGTPVASQTPQLAGGNKQIVISGATFAAPPLHAADFNRLAYNPAVTYTAPKKADGTPLTNTGTDAKGNYGTTALAWATSSVDRDPFHAYELAAGVTPMWPNSPAATPIKDNLSSRVNVSLYCNSDWPLLVNDVNWPVGPNGATALDVGDVNAQYQGTKGAHCRINGTAYDASAATGAPAVTDDYNYPWQSSSGVNGGQYFYRSLSVKTLWCDKTSPNWPQNITSVLTGCSDGSTPIGGTSTPQSCNAGTPTNVCNPVVASRTYTANLAPNEACDTSATYCNAPGSGSLPECRACTCVNDTPRTNYSCSINGAGCGCVGAGCGGPTTCANVVTAPTGCATGTPVYTTTYSPKSSANCTDASFDTVLKTNTGPTLLADAGAPNTTGAPGNICRHNNYTYAVGGAAGLFKYSSGSPAFPGEGNGTGLFNTSTTGNCPAVGGTIQIPRHYYVIDNVTFCDNRVATVNDQWRGFGTGTCQENNDLNHYKDVKFGKFTRIDLFPTNARTFTANSKFAGSSTPYPKGSVAEPASRVWLDSTTPTPETSESVNYANWYAYYSTRLNAGKSTSATAFSYLTNVPPDPIAYRVGFHNLGEEPTGYGGAGTPIIWLDVADWDSTQRTAWYNKLFGISVSTYKTPTLDAMVRIGHLFETGGASGMPAGINPLPAAAADPIALKPDGTQITCQNNYHILFTDGKTNQVTPLTMVGDKDESIDATLVALGATGTESYQKLDGVAAGTWPAPFRQGTPAVGNTLSDVATYYWTRDLRPSLKNDVPNQSGEQTALTCTNASPLPCTSPPYPLGVYSPGEFYQPALDPTKDVAWWQHVNFNAISFGAEGTLDAGGSQAQLATLASIKSGTANWPDLTQPYNPINPKGAGAGAVAVDDLWHATMMSRGSFVFARSPLEVSYGLASILSGIQNQRKSRAGAAFGGQVLDEGNDVIFEPTIEPGWAGDLLKIQVFTNNGEAKYTWWSAAKTLATQIDPLVAGVAEPWMDPVHRRIVTLTGTTGPGIPFQHADLSSAQRLSLAPTTLQQQKIVAYLRGGGTYAGVPIEGVSIGQYRKRFGAMGDISNAKPVIVFQPDRPYVNATDPGYEDFRTAKKDRAVRVVAPANDGMVHVFDAGPMPKAKTATDPAVPVSAGGGTEVFAFIPKALFKGVAGTAAEDASGIQALTYQDGGVPIYRHHMYVDSSPRTADVDFGTGDDWRTIVVGGLGKGGNSYYALDLTDAEAVDETAASAKVLWEWSNSEVKYSYGRPVIVKVRDAGGAVSCGDGNKCRWVVIVTGGYDNASGKGKIFFLDAKTGTLLSTITTSAGDPPASGQAAGLAQIHAFVKNQNNQIAEQLYGGDLLGNVWRIDVSGTDTYKTASAELFAQLKDPSGVAQPITVAPQIEIDINNGVDRYVFIGTGRLLDVSDLTSPSPPQTQTMYAIRDGTLQSFSTTGLPIQPRVTLKPTEADGVSGIAGGAPNGWYHDLPNVTGDSERMVVDPQSNVNVAAYVGTLVQEDPCIISLPAKLYARDYTTGESLTEDAGGAIIASIDYPKGLVDIETVGMIQADGSQRIGIIGSQEVPGIKPAPIKNKFTGLGTRMSWRLLGGE